VESIDTFDHLVEINSVRRKTKRWPYNVFMFMIDAATQNAIFIYVENILKKNIFAINAFNS
jgi:hypothetical protein